MEVVLLFEPAEFDVLIKAVDDDDVVDGVVVAVAMVAAVAPDEQLKSCCGV